MALGLATVAVIAFASCAGLATGEPDIRREHRQRAPSSPPMLDLPAELDGAARDGSPSTAAQPPAVEPQAPNASDASSRASEPPPPSASQVAVEARLAAYYSDFGRREWAAYEQHFWPDATIVAVRQPPGGGAERVVPIALSAFVEEMRRLGEGGEHIEFQLGSPRIEVQGVVALARVDYTAKTVAQNEPQPWRGCDMFLFVLHEDAWRIASLALGATDRSR